RLQPELRVLPRAAARRRRPAGRPRRAAYRRIQPGGGPALRAARRAGLSRDHAPGQRTKARAHDGGAGYRRDDPGRGARGFLLRHQSRRRRDRGTHAPAGKNVAHVAAWRAAAAPRLAAFVEQILQVLRREPAAHALAVGEDQRGRAVDGEAAPELEYLVDRIAATLGRVRHLGRWRRGE